MKQSEVIMLIKGYFDSHDKDDVMKCGCGCGTEIGYCHGQAARHKKDLIKIFKNVCSSVEDISACGQEDDYAAQYARDKKIAKKRGF